MIGQMEVGDMVEPDSSIWQGSQAYYLKVTGIKKFYFCFVLFYAVVGPPIT